MKQCTKCEAYLWDETDDVCPACSQVEKPPEQPKAKVCAYCGEPANERYAVWINGVMIVKLYCSGEHASYAQMGAEG